MTPTPANNINDDIDDETPLINRDEKSESSKFKQRKKKEEQKQEQYEESSEYEYESEVDSQVREVIEQASKRQEYNNDLSPMLDYFYTLDSGHKDFVRSMI